MSNITLDNVLDFINAATPTQLSIIKSALAEGKLSAQEVRASYQNARRAEASKTLANISVADTIDFLHDGVRYEGLVLKVNATTAQVQITKITGTPRNRRFTVGTKIQVPAEILAKSLAQVAL